MRHKIYVLFFFCILFSSEYTQSQELIATVQCDIQQVQASNKDFLFGFDKKIESYINTYRWIGKNYNEDKIMVNINIFFTSGNIDNLYNAKIVIESQRPIYDGEKKSGKSSKMVRVLDDKWDFVFQKDQSLNHEDRRFDPLTSFLDFYMYIILGYDSDTYDNELKGTPSFEKAQSICQLASSYNNSGWKKTPGVAYSRWDFIDELLNPKFTPVRKAFFQYHFNGLDLKTQNSGLAFKNVIKAIDDIGNVKKILSPNSIIIRNFFDLKHLEIGDFFKDYEDQTIYDKLIKIDNSHYKTYQEYNKTR